MQRFLAALLVPALASGHGLRDWYQHDTEPHEHLAVTAALKAVQDEVSKLKGQVATLQDELHMRPESKRETFELSQIDRQTSHPITTTGLAEYLDIDTQGLSESKVDFRGQLERDGEFYGELVGDLVTSDARMDHLLTRSLKFLTPHGQLIAAGIGEYSDEYTKCPTNYVDSGSGQTQACVVKFVDGKSSIPVVGGTGHFAGAHGVLWTRQDPTDERIYIHHFELVLPNPALPMDPSAAEDIVVGATM
jgi:hypothetical protein